MHLSVNTFNSSIKFSIQFLQLVINPTQNEMLLLKVNDSISKAHPSTDLFKSLLRKNIFPYRNTFSVISVAGTLMLL